MPEYFGDVVNEPSLVKAQICNIQIVLQIVT